MWSRLCKILISLAFAMFAGMSCYNNISDAPANIQYIKTVITMVDVYPGSPTSRAILSSESSTLFLAVILSIEGLVSVLLIAGSLHMLQHVGDSEKVFQHSKSLVMIGFTLAVMLWFLGFVVIAGEWFLAWQSAKGGGAVKTAYTISTIALLALVFVSLRDGEVE